MQFPGKLFIQSAIILLSVFMHTDVQAQSIQYVQVQEQSCNNIMLITGFPYSTGVSYTFLYEWGDGTSNSNTFTIYLPGNKIYSSHTYPQPGKYTIKVVRIHNANRVDSASVSCSIACKFITISNYLDDNANCVYDKGESMLTTSAMVKIDSASIPIDTISVLGKCYYKVDSGVFYTVTLLNPLAGSVFTCAGAQSVTIKTTGKDSVSFPLKCTSSTAYDLGVSLNGLYRRTGSSMIWLQVDNKSCSAQNAVVTLNIDYRFKYKSASVTPSSISGNTITWNINNLSAISGKYINVTLDTAVGAILVIHDTICSAASISPSGGDIYPANNNVTQCDLLRNGWDPNDKFVSPAGDILPGTRLTYHINFENLGNDTAFFVSILDTLSEYLDVKSLEMISSSHKMFYHIIDTPTGKNIIRFVFEDIKLPDSNSRAYNKGFVRFSIKTNNSLAYYTQIKNRAGIYFDTNPVVLTNYAENRIAGPTSVESAGSAGTVSVYPNPVNDLLIVEIRKLQYDRLQMLNMLGQVILEKTIHGNTTELSLGQLAPGIYQLVLSGDNDVNVIKIEKQ